MSDDLSLLVTLYQHHEMGDSLLKCAIKADRWLEFDDEHLMENAARIKELLPMHVASVGPIVDVELIFEVKVCD